MKVRLEYKPIWNWGMELSEKEPEILCISGPYLDQLIFREVRNQSAQDVMHCSWSDHHHGHSTVYRSGIKLKDVLKLIDELKENHTFTLQKELKFSRQVVKK